MRITYVCTGVHWLTEHSCDSVLKPSDSTTIGMASITVLKALTLNPPVACTPPDWILSPMDKLPFCEDLEITGSYILSIGYQLQSDTGPGGCDTSQWQNVLLRLVPLVLMCRILLQDCVIIFAFPLFPGLVMEFWWSVI